MVIGTFGKRNAGTDRRTVPTFDLGQVGVPLYKNIAFLMYLSATLSETFLASRITLINGDL